MKKSDLKNGMIVKTRDGDEYIVIKYCLNNLQETSDVLLSTGGGYMGMDEYNDDLICPEDSDFDIMEICLNSYGGILYGSGADVHTLIWERQNKKEIIKELTLDEIEKQLGYKVKIVNKEDNVK